MKEKILKNIAALLDGEVLIQDDVEYKLHHGILSKKHSYCWQGFFYSNFEFFANMEIKTPKRFINGIEVPYPLTEVPEQNETVFVVDCMGKNLVEKIIYDNANPVMSRWLAQGLIFKTAWDAEGVARALLSCLKEG